MHFVCRRSLQRLFHSHLIEVIMCLQVSNFRCSVEKGDESGTRAFLDILLLSGSIDRSVHLQLLSQVVRPTWRNHA